MKSPTVCDGDCGHGSVKNTSAAVAKAERLIAVRERCGSELYKRLRADFDERTAAAAVADVTARGLVDDARFAREYADYLTRKKGYAPRRIELELRAKGVDAGLAKAAAAEFAYSADERAEKLSELAEKKYGRDLREAAELTKSEIGGTAEIQKITARVVRNFVGKGYSVGEILKIIKDITGNL